jgi:hypothetical protein
MAKNNQHRPSNRLPYVVQNRKLREQIDEVERQAARMRRYLWMAVRKAGGRLEIDQIDFQAAMRMPPEDSCIGIRHENGKAIFIFTDEKGEPLPEQKKSDIIITDQ